MAAKPNVVIINSGCANLASVDFALRRLGIDARITEDEKLIKAADKVVLPGVGTALAAMNELQSINLIDVIKSLTQPVLGICLGMQLLTEFSDETNGVNLLNIIPTQTKLIIEPKLPVPHCGWNLVTPTTDHPLFKGLSDNAYFYFVHSYRVAMSEYTIAKTHYGQDFSAAIGFKNFMGVQFHPERSGRVGAQLLKNFIEI